LTYELLRLSIVHELTLAQSSKLSLGADET